MKTNVIIISLLVITLFSRSSASEVASTLEEKIYGSTDVFVATVISFTRVDLIEGSQQCKLKMKVNEVILGEAAKEITVNCCSVQYSKKTDGGYILHFSSTGFSGHSIDKGGKYIAYLKKSNGEYYLSENSNQSLEIIQGGRVNDIGQTTKTVSLEQKLMTLRKLAKYKKANKTLHTNP